jgi:hypothetical protein
MTVFSGLKVLSAVAVVSIATGVFAQQRGLSLVDKVRAANDRFKDVSVAISEGYAAIPCVGAPNRYGLGPFYELHVWAWKANPLAPSPT